MQQQHASARVLLVYNKQHACRGAVFRVCTRALTHADKPFSGSARAEEMGPFWCGCMGITTWEVGVGVHGGEVGCMVYGD